MTYDLKLALTVPFHHGETFPSFVSRLSRRNGNSYVQDFMIDFKLNWQNTITANTHTVNTIAMYTGENAHALSEFSFKRIGGFKDLYEIRGQKLAKKFMTRVKLRLCPICMDEDILRGHYEPYVRALWQLACAYSCPNINAYS